MSHVVQHERLAVPRAREELLRPRRGTVAQDRLADVTNYGYSPPVPPNAAGAALPSPRWAVGRVEQLTNF